MTGATKASPQPLDRLYEIDTPLALCHCLTAFQTAVKDTFATLSQADEDALIAEILGGDKPIHPDLYRRYADNLRRAVKQVPVDDNLAAQWQANVSRFAAYKAYHATNDIRAAADTEHARTALHNYNRWQAAEYNTAVTRARTGRQWQQWDNPDDRRLFPNIKWIPSRSATPREEHIPFYNRIWPKDDPFWQNNQPGNLWNCKCDWEETDDPVTGDNPEGIRPAKGLEGNPADTGEIFTEQCTYIKNSGHNRRQREEVEKNCERVSQNLTSSVNKQAMSGKSTTCTINGTELEVLFEPVGIEHYAQDCFGNKELFWIKNEILPIVGDYIQKASCTAKKRSDVSHNTNRKTLRLKRQTSYFYYFPITLPNQQSAVLHLGMYNSNKVGKEGKMYLYSITKNMPDNTETP